jgi:hypothetical protein
MLSQLAKMSSFERPMSSEKEQKGLYKSSSLQQNSTKVLEYLFGIVVKSGHTWTIVGMCLFFHFSFFHAWLYVQCFVRSIKHIGSKKNKDRSDMHQ